jgi:hypothetical protein
LGAEGGDGIVVGVYGGEGPGYYDDGGFGGHGGELVRGGVR